MAASRRVVVIGATGVFGRLLTAELETRRDIEVVPAARHDTSLVVDMSDAASVREAAAGAFAVACAAGPFQGFDRQVVRGVVEAGAHWLDIADDPDWFFALIDDPQLDRLARECGVVVASGLSTFPAVSGALVRRLQPRTPHAEHAVITLWIGNRNAKGAGSIASALASHGDRLITPDETLLRRELGIAASASVEFQAPGATAALRFAGGLRSFKTRARIGRALSALSSPFSRFGTDRAVLRVAMDGQTDEVRSRGQRLAVAPLVFVLDRLLSGLVTTTGCGTPATVAESGALLKFVEEESPLPLAGEGGRRPGEGRE